MKNCLLLFFLAASFCNALSAQKKPKTATKADLIQAIDSGEQIETIIKPLLNRYDKFNVNNHLINKESIKRLSDSLHLKPWVKIDFDGNGYTDILVIGYEQVLVVMNYGSKHLKLYHIEKYFDEQTLPLVKTIGSIPVIIRYIKRDEYGAQEESPLWTTDTLSYKFDDFLEFKKRYFLA